MKPPLFILLIVTACAPALPVFKPVTVDTPIAVPCAAPAVEKPPYVLPQAANTSLFDKTKAALIELDQREAYEAKLEAALAACR